jgi:hypothetical protein
MTKFAARPPPHPHPSPETQRNARRRHRIIATKNRYPKCEFALGDALLPGGMSHVRGLCERRLAGGAPTVVCIDINGNREIDDVLGCLGAVMNEPWSNLPRMIIVKSRFLYWEMMKKDGGGGGVLLWWG